VAGIDVRHLGDYIRDQRRDSNVSLRQLAKLAGVSNPYLSQIERGLRKPSAEILQQIAKALRISAEALYVQAGILEQREGSGIVADSILADDGLNERQKQVLLEIYDSFRKEKVLAPDAATVPAALRSEVAGATEPLATKPAPAKESPAKKSPAKKSPARKASTSKTKNATPRPTTSPTHTATGGTA
jgi:transcriptional regulator with XRE-family HTH domain